VSVSAGQLVWSDISLPVAKFLYANLMQFSSFTCAFIAQVSARKCAGMEKAAYRTEHLLLPSPGECPENKIIFMERSAISGLSATGAAEISPSSPTRAPRRKDE
jgi:hypothetical protein